MTVFSEAAILAHVGNVDTVKRGIVYAKAGAILDLDLRDATLHAKVEGGGHAPYTAWVTFAANDRNQVAVAFCSCADGGDGRCKHVAAALYAHGRKIDVDRSLLKRVTTGATASAATAGAAKRSSAAHTPVKRVLPSRSDRVAAAASPVKQQQPQQPPVTVVDCDSQDDEIRIVGERERDLRPPVAAAAAAAAVARPANWFNRALSDLHSSQQSGTATDGSKTEPVAQYTTLQSFNAMQTEIRQLQVLLRWTRLAHMARIARLQQRVAALERENRLSKAALPHQMSFEPDSHNHSDETLPPPPPTTKDLKRKARAAATPSAAVATTTPAKQRRRSPPVRPEYQQADDDEEW